MEEGQPIPPSENISHKVGFGNEQAGKVELNISREGSFLKEASRLQQEMAALKEKANQRLNGVFSDARSWTKDQEDLILTVEEKDGKSGEMGWHPHSLHYYITEENGVPARLITRVFDADDEKVNIRIWEFGGSEQTDPEGIDEKDSVGIYRNQWSKERSVEVFPASGQKRNSVRRNSRLNLDFGYLTIPI